MKLDVTKEKKSKNLIIKIKKFRAFTSNNKK
jgi:hypothetical protein